MTMTDNEIEVIEMSLNYADREGQLSDNYSNFDADTFARVMNTSRQAIGGIVSSLIQKGYMYDDGDGPHSMIWITDDGVNAIFDIIDAREKS